MPRRSAEVARVGLVVPLQGPAGIFGPSCEAVAATASQDGPKRPAGPCRGTTSPTRATSADRRRIDPPGVDGAAEQRDVPDLCENRPE